MADPASLGTVTDGDGNREDSPILTGKGDQDNSEVATREQDLFLPIANIGRIMKRGVPKEGKITKAARLTVQECVSEFISFITGEANERCRNEKRKAISGEDIISAFHKLGFDNYVEPLTLYLNKYRQAVAGAVADKGPDNGSTINEPGETSSAQKNGENSLAPPWVNTAPGSVYGGGTAYVHPQMIFPGSYQLQMAPQMIPPPYAAENRQLFGSSQED